MPKKISEQMKKLEQNFMKNFWEFSKFLKENEQKLLELYILKNRVKEFLEKFLEQFLEKSQTKIPRKNSDIFLSNSFKNVWRNTWTYVTILEVISYRIF